MTHSHITLTTITISDAGKQIHLVRGFRIAWPDDRLTIPMSSRS